MDKQPVDYSFANQYNDNAEVPINSMIVHQDFRLVDLQKFNADVDRRFSGTFTTNNPESYFAYVSDRANEDCAQNNRTFINAENPETRLFAETVLNFGETALPGLCDDKAILVLVKDPLFVKFLEDTRQPQEATDFAETLEAFLGTENIWGMKEGEQIKLANAVKAIRNAKIDKQSTSELNTTGLQYTGSDFEKIAIESADKNLADSFGFKTPIYLNLAEQEVTFAVDVRFQSKDNGGQKALYSLRPFGLLNHYLKAAENFQTLVSGKIEDTLIGTFEKR